MPVRGLIVVLALISAIAAGWYLINRGADEPKGASVSKDITPAGQVQPHSGDESVIPAFTAARIGATGQAEIKGRAAPGSKLSLWDHDRKLGEAVADDGGAWAIVLDRGLGVGVFELGLKSAREGGEFLAPGSLILFVGRAGTTPLAVAMRFGRPSLILQRPDDLPSATLAVDSVDYSSGGEILIAGHAPAGSPLRLYLDNQIAGDVQADEQGVWSFTPQTVAPGAYTLRLDELDEKGSVSKRIEVPFERLDPDTISHSLPAKTNLSVEPGEGKWRIARALPGGLYQYTFLYRSGQDQVRDPAATYPGQVLEMGKAAKP